MRLPLLVAVLLALSACAKNNQANNMQNADEGMTAESIVSNDVTAIDAVTGDAANMAADVDMNYGNLDDGSGDTTNNVRPSKAPAEKPSSAPKAESNTAAPASTNTTGNSE